MLVLGGTLWATRAQGRAEGGEIVGVTSIDFFACFLAVDGVKSRFSITSWAGALFRDLLYLTTGVALMAAIAASDAFDIMPSFMFVLLTGHVMSMGIASRSIGIAHPAMRLHCSKV